MDQSSESKELQLFIDSDAELYRRQGVWIQKNLTKKWKAGKYDHTKAPRLWRYYVDNGAKEYNRQFGNNKKGYGIFTPAIRQETAQSMADAYAIELGCGNFTE